MSLALVTGGVLGAAVLLGWLRLARWQGTKLRGMRWWALMALQPLAAGMLWLALNPPAITVPGSTLVVAVRGAAAGTYDVRMPEAPAAVGGALLPDLATALRQRPSTVLRVVGQGLEPRDVSAIQGRRVEFSPLPMPSGLVRLDKPAAMAVGGALVATGGTSGLVGGSVELLDPAGRSAARGPVGNDGDFRLTARVRAAGAADWKLRLRDSADEVVETAILPVVVDDNVQPSLRIRAGAPGAELKYLARWAADAGLAYGSDVALGGGVVMGAAPLAMTAAALGRTDALVLDERSWAGLSSGERAAVMAAVRSGMGLVLRITGPVPPAVRTAWASLGMGLVPGDAPRDVKLASGSVVQAMRLAAPRSDAVPWLRNASGAPVAIWRAVGSGRVALWPLIDSYALVLAGKSVEFSVLWSDVLSVVARTDRAAAPRLPAWGFVGERMRFCGLTGPASISAADGMTIALEIDPAAAGCAGYWPATTGWHLLRLGDVAWPVRVLPADALPGVNAANRRAATLLLAKNVSAAPDPVGTRNLAGPAWPWWLAFVAMVGLLWWFERSRLGVPGSQSA